MSEVKIPVRHQIRETDLTPPPAGHLADGEVGFNRTPTDIRMWLGTGAGSPREVIFGTGTVTSVGLIMPSEIYNSPVGNSPIANSGSLQPTLKSQGANLIFASPDGAGGTPIFRNIVIDDFAALPRLDEWEKPTADLDIGGQKLTNVGDPGALTDAPSWGYAKDYIDANVQGARWKQPVRLASTATDGNITLSGVQNVDGSATVDGDRILLKHQTDPAENGIYIADAGAWSRATDADTWDELVSATVSVEEGLENADKALNCTIDTGGTINTDAIAFVEMGTIASLNAGAGLTKSGQTLNVGGTADRIEVAADTVDIAPTYAGQASITILGTITTGIWQGTPVAVAYGGTGGTTPAEARTNLGLERGTDVQAWSQKLEDIASTPFNDNEVLFAFGGRIVSANSVLSGDGW